MHLLKACWTIDGQSKEHALLAFTVGVKQLIVVLNKMDACNYAQARYADIKAEVSAHLKKVGYKVDRMHFIPITGSHGDNLTERSAKMSGWYQGPTLLEALDSVDAPVRRVEKPLRLPIQEVYHIGGIGTVSVGRIESGTLTPGTHITIGPVGLTSQVQSLEMHHALLAHATAGDHVGIHCAGVEVKDIKRGYVVSNSDEDPAKACDTFKAQMIIMQHPGLIRNGYTPVMHCHTSQVPARFKHIDAKMDRRTGKELEQNPRSVKGGDACMVTIEPLKPLVVEAYEAYPPLGRFCVRDMRQTVAVGVIRSVVHRGGDGLASGSKTNEARK